MSLLLLAVIPRISDYCAQCAGHCYTRFCGSFHFLGYGMTDDSLAGCGPSFHSFFPLRRNQLFGCRVLPREQHTAPRSLHSWTFSSQWLSQTSQIIVSERKQCRSLSSSASTNLPPLPRLSPLRSHSLMLVWETTD